MTGINQRELGRKERATAECERQIRRYGYECGEVVTYKLSPEQLLQVLAGQKAVEDCIKENKSND